MSRKSTIRKASPKKAAPRKGPVQSVARKAAATAPSAEPKQSKKSILTDLLKRPDGASIVDMIAATGWQSHSIRATITGLRKNGHLIALDRNAESGSRYRIEAAAK